MTSQDIVKAAREGMQKAVENTRRELSGIRSGKATTNLLDTVRVEAYGSAVPLNQVAMVTAPEPRMLVVQPFDKSLAIAIDKAIRDANLGLNPQSQGQMIRVPLPMLSEERRKELVKICARLTEEGRVSVRQARTDAMTKIKKLEKVPEDEKTRAEKDVQKHTDEASKQVDELLKAKEAEILAV
ncbi:MAG: ribosome recycling factor [Gemmatimonadetes bacterium]|jgi:ribosome recycling factor|nr:ribosome recycling factor [Gemmatimonadota bacterium]MBK9547733.1 ribosome recycling factor [Gemmatimonadota bacterium]MBP6442480.1 ribosome recycling factor [Gemmatimonadales bacterium]MBP6571170.1 ribosome recycling factor [Gemmatimonadales bacterium]MBP7621721.1 ribosome recycling factor [Gemmatimonadales bacterium]